MSLMTESLLLHAQSLRAEGENDASIDVLGTVISQCDSDIVDVVASVGGHRDGRVSTNARRIRAASCRILATMLLQRSGRKRRGGDGGSRSRPRPGRGSNSDENDDGLCDDERRADALLHKLGYKTRISIAAFGYPPCSSCCILPPCLPSRPPPSSSTRDDKAINSRGRYFSRAATSIDIDVVDDALPVSIFGALKRAFRPRSRYWSEFYHRREGRDDDGNSPTRDGDDDDDDDDDYGDYGDDKNDNGAGLTRRRKRRRTNADDDDDDDHRLSHFASHNIPLLLPPGPCGDDDAAASVTLLDMMGRSRSVLEQAAIVLVRRHLARRFPEIANATSVEVWCHKRPRDHGGHRLHYDMDEIALWEHRRKAGDGGSRERPKTNHNSRDDDDDKNDDDDGVHCPIVSCVLTISVPDDECRSCGGVANSAPTIVCPQSILASRRCPRDEEGKEDDDDDGGVGLVTENCNVGCLCFPRPNRLLSFDGSLLHGVLPGIPARRFARTTTRASSRDGDNNQDREGGGGGSVHDDDGDGVLNVEDDDNVENHRITLMMGFWRDVRKTMAIGDDEASSSSDAAGRSTKGPNVPYSPRGGTWTEEFEPISVIGDDLAITETRSVRTDELMVGINVIDPLWIPIIDVIVTEEDAKSFGEYSRHGGDDEIQPSSRFFLRSMDPRVIDDEVLSGT